ncbi:MAG TPA: acyl-CoA dehydrogenase family protein [Actinocrinis sp.]|uniref:acyl-CoA dehydrogenase family protein n=1 Tax=Actinocrinis sp. TaxID=1920516 RepID=UPI002DDD3B9E|nr:acyl-CoA dehydrogenase family protein [Actinocrinis sp.]HEV2347693.1 acyl-CoA dehydrogenase family protein [Actinocrinis sp.]
MDFSIDEPSRKLVNELDDRFLRGIASRAPVTDEVGAIPPENWREIAQSDYARLFHPASVGGLGADGVTQAMAMERLARACPSTFWSATMSVLVCAKLIHTYGDAEHHGRLLEPLLRFERLACFPVVENTSGSDASTYTTAVRRDADGYVITGEKSRITNATTADLGVVLARFEEHEYGWCYAFVDLRQDGVRTYRMHDLGLRGMPWGGIVFNRARIGVRDVVPVRLEEFPHGMAWGWLFISIAAIAIAQNALDASIAHARSHKAFGRPLIHMDRVQEAIAEMRTQIDAARLLAYRCAWHRAEGRLAQDLVGMLKPYATEMAVRATQHAVQIHGAWGLTHGYPVERMYRDAPMNVIGGFASNRLRELVAQDLGLPTPYQDFDWLKATGLDVDCAVHPGALLSAGR